jgi:hypothetical protein
MEQSERTDLGKVKFTEVKLIYMLNRGSYLT